MLELWLRMKHFENVCLKQEGEIYFNVSFNKIRTNQDKLNLGGYEMDAVIHKATSSIDENILNNDMISLDDLKRPFNNNG